MNRIWTYHPYWIHRLLYMDSILQHDRSGCGLSYACMKCATHRPTHWNPSKLATHRSHEDRSQLHNSTFLTRQPTFQDASRSELWNGSVHGTFKSDRKYALAKHRIQRSVPLWKMWSCSTAGLLSMWKTKSTADQVRIFHLFWKEYEIWILSQDVNIYRLIYAKNTAFHLFSLLFFLFEALG